MVRSRVPSEERIFSLVLALIASGQGLTKHELLSSVYGYAERYRVQTERVALDRQFERDKEQLRALGIPVETLESPGEPGNNQLLRYRISKTAFAVPPGLSFSERELMLLRMAALAWREGSLTDESRRAAMKLESLGAGVSAPNLGVTAGFGTSEPSAPALLAAIDAGHVAEFLYQLPGRDEPHGRLVHPLRLHRFEGRWHLIAYDLERDAPRVFLLSRIVGAVSHRGPRPHEAERPGDADRLINEAVSELEQLQERQRAIVRVRTDSTAHAQLLARESTRAPEASDADGAEFTLLDCGTADYREFGVLLAGFGADAVVIEPESLRTEVVSVLRAMRDRHAGTRGGGSEARHV